MVDRTKSPAEREALLFMATVWERLARERIDLIMRRPELAQPGEAEDPSSTDEKARRLE